MADNTVYSTSCARDGVSDGRVRRMGANDGSEEAMAGGQRGLKGENGTRTARYSHFRLIMMTGAAGRAS